MPTSSVQPIHTSSISKEHEALHKNYLPEETMMASGEMHTLISCEEEAIQFCEGVQSYGKLIAFETSSGRISAFSANIDALFNVDVKDESTDLTLALLGTNFYDLLANAPRGTSDSSSVSGISPALSAAQTDMQQSYRQVQLRAIQESTALLSESNGRAPIALTFDSDRLTDTANAQHSCVLYALGPLTVIEIEQEHACVNTDNLALPLTSRLPDLTQFKSIEDLTSCMVDTIKEMTGYDRVMMYRFNERWHGQVVAEAREPHLEAYLGLNYPATDIPAQARALYKKNLIRMIENVDDQPIAILPKVKTHGREKPLDMSNSMLRSVSPFHIQYLKNMGVQATMSISIVINGQLWGLIACHHYSPKYLSQTTRFDCESLGQFFGWQIQTKEDQIVVSSRINTDLLIDRIISGLADNEGTASNIASLQEPLLKLLDASGFTLYLGKETHELGKVLPLTETKQLAELFLEQNTSRVQASSNLKEDLDFICDSNTHEITGALFIPLSSSYNYFAMWFRTEKVHTINWAGAPDVKEIGEENRLTPRGSFALWRETVRGSSTDWTESDLKTADRFNRLFVAHVIERKIDVERNLQKLQELDRAKDQFLASISHELRTPLSVIVGWADLGLANNDSPSQMMEALTVIRKNATTQSELINDLLDISRIVSGTLKLQVKSLDLHTLLDDVHKSFSTACRAKEIDFSMDCDSGLQVILGDPVRIKQVFSNIVSNAIKFTGKGGKVTLKSHKSHSSYVIEISDTGKGIEKEDLGKIFDRFTQLHASHGRSGMGLGLSIVQSLVDMHGGTIKAYSEGRGRGSSFTVSFPVSPVVLDRAEEKAIVHSDLDGTEDKASGRLAGLRILAVEDEPDAATFLGRVLSNQGAEVILASNGVEALGILEKQTDFDVLLSDIGMPEMNGYDLVKEVRRSNSSYKDISAIALTAYAFSSDRVKALKAGFQSYVTKPVDLEELYTVIETTCTRSGE